MPATHPHTSRPPTVTNAAEDVAEEHTAYMCGDRREKKKKGGDEARVVCLYLRLLCLEIMCPVCGYQAYFRKNVCPVVLLLESTYVRGVCLQAG